MRHGRFPLVKRRHSQGFRSSLSVLLLVSLSLVAGTEPTSALDFSAGLGAVENGDDRGHGVAIAQLGFSNGWLGRLYYWGRTQGPVTETNNMLTAAKRFGLFGGKTLRGAVGMTVMSETTEIKFKDYPDDNTSATSTNGGVYLGLDYDLFAIKSVTISASWDAHLFPAGGAMIALVTGRKQVLGVTAGVTF
jgi:hypothetical protein